MGGFISPFGNSNNNNNNNNNTNNNDDVQNGERQNQSHRQLFKKATTLTTMQEDNNNNIKKKQQHRYWRCLFAKRKATAVKRKTLKFEDGALRVDVETNDSVLYNEKGEKKAKGKPGTIVEGTECSLQQYEIEIDNEIEEKEFASGMAFANIDVGVLEKDDKEDVGDATTKKKQKTTTAFSNTQTFMAANNTKRVVTANMLKPVYSIDAPNACVLYDGQKPNTIGPIPLVLDPSIAPLTLLHQKRGVKFMLESCLNITSETRSGCCYPTTSVWERLCKSLR